MIRVIGLRKTYGPTVAVDGVSFEVAAGEVFGFIGPNGAGKTTTIRMMIGLLAPTAGTVLLGGHDIRHEPEAAKAITGYLADHPFLYDKLTAREFLEFMGALYRVPEAAARARAEKLLKLLELDTAADALIEAYSHGMRQKTALAGALLHNPQAFFLDEPTVGLDPRSARLIKDILREVADRGTAVFMSTHILEIAERMCDRVAIISEGRVIAIGTMDELRAGRTGESLEDIFLALTGGSEEAEITAALA
jgi:ABC-2 type transport system ATP-binding protein